jgi:hypothetical protein
MLSCGGGSGDSTTADSVVSAEAVVVESPTVVVVADVDVDAVEPILAIDIVEPDPNAIYESTAELIASKSFLLEQEYELAISYKNADDRDAYLSVCTDFTEGEGGIKVNYNSCLLRTAIESDYASTLTVANDKHRLVMAIWYFDDMKNPKYTIWENDGDSKAIRTFDVQ